MKTLAGREKYFLLTMVGLGMLLAGVLLWEWERGMALERSLLALRKMPVTAVPPQKVLPEFMLPDLQTGFPELLARPVFSPNRRAYATAGQAEAEMMKKGQFVLVGVLLSPRQQSALLRDIKTGKTETVAKAGTIRSMVVGDIQANRVVLRQGDESEELLLNVQTGPKVVPPQRTMVAPLDTSVPPPRMPASGAVPPGVAPPAMLPASAPRPLTAPELIQREKQQQIATEAAKKQGPSVPAGLPPAAGPK